MQVKTKWIVYGVEYGSYFNKAGDEVKFCLVHYLDPADKRNDRDWIGYVPLNKNVTDLGFSEKDFQDLPGFYYVTYVPSRGRRGVIEPKLTNCEFEKSIIFPTSDHLLLLGAKRFDYEIDGKKVRGNKCFAINTDGSDMGQGLMGYGLLEFTWSGRLTDLKCPAWYDVNLIQARGRKGDTVLKAVDLTYKSFLDLLALPNSAVVSNPLAS